MEAEKLASHFFFTYQPTCSLGVVQYAVGGLGPWMGRNEENLEGTGVEDQRRRILEEERKEEMRQERTKKSKKERKKERKEKRQDQGGGLGVLRCVEY